MHTVSYKRSFLIGCLLGDAYSRIRGKNKHAEFVVSHGNVQEDLVRWKAKQVVHILNLFNEPKVYPNAHKMAFSITKGKRLRVIHDWFHRGKIKVISEKIRFLDHPVGLAMLLCDDGSVLMRKKKHKDGIKYYLKPCLTIATHGFSDDCVGKLINHLDVKFGIKSYINYERRIRNGVRKIYPRLRLNANESEKLWNLVKPHMPAIESMRVKFCGISEWQKRGEHPEKDEGTVQTTNCVAGGESRSGKA